LNSYSAFVLEFSSLSFYIGVFMNDHNPIEAMMRERGERIDSLTIADIIREAHSTAVEKGWWEQDRSFSEGIALMHSELSEALEEWRKHGMNKLLYYVYQFGPDTSYLEVGIQTGPDPGDVAPGPGKPEGIAAELADVIIRIADYCGKYDIPLEEALKAKMAYNKTRPHRHGGKLA
jgi:NTP pyrophosphatase (non-canonical NTP hydrolase)